MTEHREFPNGMTVRELKEVIKDWPEEDWEGEEAYVWLEDSEGHTSVVHAIYPLDRRTVRGKTTADILFEA